MKKNIGKRILSLALALVMVVGLLPMTAYANVLVNASAVNALCDTYKNCIYLTELTKDGVDKLPYVYYVNITGCTRNGNKVTFNFRCQRKSNSEGITVTGNFTITDADCNQAVNTTATYNSSSGTKATFTINRSAKSHTGGTATCIAKAKCSACGKEYGDYGDHSWGDWTYSNGKHSRTCTLDGTHTESANCTRGENDRCTVCETNLVASLTSGDTTTYYKTADEAFAAAQAAGSGTVTVLANAEYTTADTIIYSKNISLVVNPNVTLTTEAFLRMRGSISGGGTIAGTNQGWLIAYGGSTIDGITATAGLNIAGGTILSGTFAGEVQNDGTIKGGTFSGMVYNSGTIEGGTFSETVVNRDYYSVSMAGTISGGTFNCTVENTPGTIKGGTFNGQLTNETYGDPYSESEPYVEATVDADKLTLGENFRFTNQGGTVTCNTHQRRLPVTCKEGAKCIFCGNIEGDPDPTAHSLSYTAEGNVITETCAHGCADPATATLETNTGSVTYNGAAQTIEASVTHSATWRGERLTAQYKNNTDVGTATVYIQAGEAKAEKTFEITRATPTLEHFDITLPQNAVYDGSEKAATVTLASPYSKCGEITVEYYNGETKLDGAPTDAGTYTVKFRVAEGDNFNAMDLTEAGSFTITKADPNCTAPTAIAGLVYNGKEKTLIYSAESLDGTVYYSLDGSNYTESLPKGTNAQEYTVYYKVVGDANHNDMEPKTVTATIAPFNIGTASIKGGVLGDSFTYNGQEHTPDVQIDVSIPSGEANVPSTEVRLDKDIDYTVAYSNNVNAGEAVVTFTGKGNYTGTITRKFTITPKPITVTIADKTSVYGEAVAELTAATDGIVNNDTNVYSLATTATSTANAGTYPITGTALDDNYAITFVNGTYTITKAPVNSTGTDMTVSYTAGMEVDLRQMFTIDENAGEADYWITHLTGDGSFTSAPYLYRIDKAGTFTVKITTEETTNYNSGTATAVLTVNPGDPGIGAVTAAVVNDTLDTSAIVLTRENTDIDGNLTVDAGQTLAWGENTIRYTFTPTDGTNYKTVTGTVTVIVVDTVAPVGTVSIDDNQWNDLWNTITFGLFFKETKTVKVAAEDVLSGIAKVEYYDSATALSADAVKAITAWNDMGADYAQDVTAEDAKTFIYYIRITDKAGNVTYISTADATYDLTKPAISGITNGSTYYTTQKVTVTDKNIETITLNGEAATDAITLEGNKEATYTIVATDKAGNSTTVTVTMKPIKELAKATENLGNDNVTSADAPALEELVAKLDELIADPDTSDDGERETLEQHKVIAEALLKTIEDVAKATDTENTAKVEDVTADNVTPEDKSNLEDAKADLEDALENNGGNYTEEEKKAIKDEIQRIEDALETLENVEAAEDAISDLPATVEPDDEETVAKIEEAKKIYGGLTDYEKSLVDEKVKEKLDKLTAAAVAYVIVKGDGGKWSKGTASGLSFTANGPISKFVSVEIDGKVIDAKYYSVKAGSTIITLNASYLETLSVGTHTITVVYSDGETEGTFKINPKSATPATGDNFNVLLWTSVMIVSLAAIAVLLIEQKKRRYVK